MFESRILYKFRPREKELMPSLIGVAPTDFILIATGNNRNDVDNDDTMPTFIYTIDRLS